MHLARLLPLSVAALALAAPALAASPGQADICHWDATTQTARVITVSVKAVSAHVANHGDSPAAIYYADADGDGFGDAAAATDPCPNEGFVSNDTDCDDTDPAVSPGASEVPYDGFDNDCVEDTSDDDLDSDGYVLDEDCDDADATVNPGEEDVCDDAIDNDCSGEADEACDVVECPCYTAADIDVAWEAVHDMIGVYDIDDSVQWCRQNDVDYTGGALQRSTQVWFSGFSGSTGGPSYWAAYETADANFYGWSYVDGAYESAVCQAWVGGGSFDGTAYTPIDAEQIWIYVTAAEAASCSRLVEDWAADHDIVCE